MGQTCAVGVSGDDHVGVTGESKIAGPRPISEIDSHTSIFDRSGFAQFRRGKLDINFEKLDELGAGSFGVVTKAKDIKHDNLVAIKSIPKKKLKGVQKVKEEFNVIRSLDHPNICKAYEFYEDRKNIYLVMELLTGGTILETLCRQSMFTEADAANVMRQIMSALAYLHGANFIFRDLKTENVMFSHRENHSFQSEVKLIDFGLCCPFEKGAKMMKAAGTPYSVAPELVTSPVQYDQKCDAWSAGVVMYILLSGKYPFNGKTKDELLHKIRREPCSFVHPIWKRISKDAKILLSELLKKKADLRLEVGEALQYQWLQRSNANLPNENIMTEIVDSFKHFQNLNMFQKAAVTALAWRSNDEETKKLRETFSALDRDGNGHITVKELRDAIEAAGVEVPDDLAQLASQADTDGGGSIEYTEFLAAAIDKKNMIRHEVVWDAFRIFDQDGSGKITQKEMLKILTGNSGEKIRQVHGKAVEKFLDEYDSSGDAQIDFEEFMEMLMDVKDTYGGASSRTGCASSRRVSPRKSRFMEGTTTPPVAAHDKEIPSKVENAPIVVPRETAPEYRRFLPSLCGCSNLDVAASQPISKGDTGPVSEPAFRSPRSPRRQSSPRRTAGSPRRSMRRTVRDDVSASVGIAKS
eukprot:TRINITY_DN33531_c0_g1_i1.p1 TRINITY_DN33531_c0_g1~~TRINITY_DN33531_c0_g1_i1.p1  ORF type:complete len:638 (+),score=127.10 TRINITY_DN33531_c0_g1_i1:254-2167(+)